MLTTTVTSKGQVTLPKELRTILNLKRGDTLRFLKNKQGQYILKPVNQDIKTLKGCLPKPKKAVGLKEMDSAIRERKSLK